MVWKVDSVLHGTRVYTCRKQDTSYDNQGTKLTDVEPLKIYLRHNTLQITQFLCSAPISLMINYNRLSLFHNIDTTVLSVFEQKATEVKCNIFHQIIYWFVKYGMVLHH